MTTGDCCHLPGSLCDCSSSPAFSKVVEATGLGPPQYVAQVTSRDGRFLSTVIRALDTPSDGPFCRICHEGANGESLLSPCGCTGTLGAVHKSCLERWLSSSNTSYCELCHTEFAVEKRPRPLTEGLCTCCSCCLERHRPHSSCGSFCPSSSPQCHLLSKAFPSLTTCPSSHLTPLAWELLEGRDPFCPIHQNFVSEAHFSCPVICGRQCSTAVKGKQPLGQDFLASSPGFVGN
ncbi:PREDICTED: E3 ubiquitin-protein ligase MARCH2 isoform X1 [Hipposideros armiger]|uniref:E3 ubiquitin-protein ligase MARCHF2 n=1 Tax=Hipposideros armiger TaxID=186990 RepID=A0A8B7THP0_HIPAR|nr:PREDICTED: E3 ubiquitin-protein ligase MARCH2 isoform X1 [Hipposideros armiger]